MAEPVASLRSPPARFGLEGKYQLLHELGHGACGRVFECRCDSNRYAVKAVNLRALRLRATAARDIKRAEGEIQILRQLPSHRRIVQMVDAFEEDCWFFLVLELVPGGTLAGALMSRSGKPPRFSEGETIFVFWQLVDGLKFLHSKNVIHRDLKLENVLISQSQPTEGGQFLYNIKISDFGLSKALGPMEDEATSCVGSRRYVAPEVLRRGHGYDKAVDLWGLGVLTFVLLSGRFPTENVVTESQENLDQAVGSLAISAAGRQLLKDLLQLDPRTRKTLTEVDRSVWHRDEEDLTMLPPTQPSQPSAGISSEPSQGEQLHQADSFMDLSQCWIPPPAPFLEIGGPSDIQEPDPELEPLSEVSMGALVTESFLAGLEEDLRQSEAAEASQPPCKRQRLESKASP